MDHVTPDAVQLADPLLGAERAEAEPLQEPEARRVLGEDASLQRPDAGALRLSIAVVSSSLPTPWPRAPSPTYALISATPS